ncbi:MAG TPA: ABC transporter permease, partial [Longimicrobiales bacterium]|nr:ABC transporter permease [Longimicrobiales bacterium]
METLIKDIRFAVYTLAKDRGFTAAALITLALCIGANSAIFSVVNSVILRPLPFADPDQLVVLYNSYPNAGAPRAGSGVPDYYDRLAGTDAFAELAMIQARGYTVGERGAPERLVGAAVTPSWFRLLRVPAARGRWFTEEEGQFGNHRKVILSYGYWQEHFGGRADAIGSSLRIQGEPHEVVGVMPAGFRFRVNDARLWTALAFAPEERADDRRHSNNHEMIGRLKPGVTLEQAQAQIDALNARNDERFPQFREILKNARFHTLVANYQIDLVRDVQSTLLFLQAGVLLVLLIGCVNIA